MAGAREEIENIFEHKDILKKYSGTGQKYTDSEFPANEKSLIRKSDTPAKWKTFVWKRATQIMPEDKIKVFDEIDPNDIIQGTLGDCYFLSSLAVLAERPNLIKRLFITEQPNTVGVYAVWLNDNGEWKHITLDDYFPCLANSNTPAFSRAHGPELWVLLLEKAYAKIHGSYDIIEGGHPALALRDLTGAPYDFLESSEPDEVWNYVKTSEDNQYLITAYTKSTEIREEQTNIGIIYGHAYSILDAKEVKTKTGNERIIRIRNPWGKFEWKGDWGDDSKKWTEDIKKQVQYVNADDGCFWMSVNDFVKYFEGVGICKFHETYRYKSIGFDHSDGNKNTTLIRLIVEEPTHIFLSVNQRDDRCFGENSGYDYSTVRIMVGQITASGLNYIDGRVFVDRNVVIENNLQPGTYVISMQVNWKQNIYRKFNISAYSEKEVNFEEMVRADFNLIERNLVKSYVLTQPNIKRKTYADRGASNIIRFSGNHLGMLFFYYANEDEKKLKETCSATKLQNVAIQPPYKNSNQYTVEVLPKDDCLVIFKLVDENIEFNYAAKYDSEITSVSYNEIQKNRENAGKTTTYIDDPDDRTEFSRDNSYFDRFVLFDKDDEEENAQPKLHNKRDNAKEKEKLKQNPQIVAADIKKDLKNIDLENQFEGKNLLDPEVWINAPKYLADNAHLGRFSIQGFERNLIDEIDKKTSNIQISKFEFAIYLAFAVLSVLICLVRPQFLDISLILGLVVLLVATFSGTQLTDQKNVILRFYPYGFFLSFLTDLYWLLVYGTNWASGDITDLGMMKFAKGITTTLSVILVIVKFIFTLVFWKKVVNTLNSRSQ